MKNNFKKYLLIFGVSLLLSMVITPVRGIDITILTLSWAKLSSLIFFLAYTLFSILILRKYNSLLQAKYIIIAISLGSIIIELIYRIFDFYNSLITLPDVGIRVYAILTGYFIFKVHNIFGKISVFILALLPSLWLSFYGYDYLIHKVSFGSFTSAVEKNIGYPIFFNTITGDSISIDDLGDKRYMVLDFFTSSCGVCFRKMPLVENLYVSGKDTFDVFAVYCTYNNANKFGIDTPQKGDSILRELNYTMPSISLDNTSSSFKYLEILCYPTTMIYDKKYQQTIFKGDIEDAKSAIEKLK